NISTSVFVTNFPGQYGAKDLWNSCKVYGHVVDAYIPDRRSKVGKRFGFVRFIKVFDVERLISNLCTIWLGRFTLHANVAQFQRELMNKHKDTVNANGTSKVNAASRKNGDGSKRTVIGRDNIPTMVLDETCLNNKEYSLSLLGKVKEFASLTNLKVVLAKEGFSSIEIKYMGGFWVMIVFQDDETKKRFQSNVAIIQAHNEFNLEERVMWVEIEGVPFLMESFKMVYCGKVCWVRAIELPGWVPDFEEDSDVETNDEVQDINSDDRNNLEGDSDIDEVPETCFEDESNKQCMDENFVRQSERQSEDPFGIYEVLKKKLNVCNNGSLSDESCKYPPGFTTNDDVDTLVNADDDVLEDNRTRNDKEDGGPVGKENQGRSAGGTDTNVSTCSGHFKKSSVPRTGGSIIQLIDDLVTVGQTIGYDMTGCLAQKAKKDWVKELCVSNKVNFVSLQETKMASIDLWFIRRCWGNFDFDYVYREAVGNSGGILCVRDPNMFKKSNATVLDFFTIVRGTWLPSGKRLLVTSVYAPQKLRDKKMLWDYLVTVICNWDGEVVTMGDFNEMSKLDRFLISYNLMRTCPTISSISLDRYFSDHRPILMYEIHCDYGPTPFKFFHYWFEIDGFDKLVEDSWKEANICDNNDYINLMKKLRFLKEKIRKWNCVYKESKNYGMRNLKVELNSLDSVIDNGNGTDLGINRRMEVIRLMQEMEKADNLERFKQSSHQGIRLEMDFVNRLSSDQRDALESEVSNDENLIECDVVKAVKWFFIHWSIPKGGNSKFITLIPKIPNANMVKDFRPISLIGSIYKIIPKILANRLVTVLGGLVNEIQSAFVADRQILDGLFILNEIVQWCKKRNKQAMVFKVDFKKAYDSVRWEFVDDILKKFGFGEKWCMWIQSCLKSSRGSVIVNGSPTQEFQFYKGLKQGIKLGSSLQVSHLFYADDAIFMGQWNQSNIDTITRVLDVFYRALGLRINIYKSKLMGISMDANLLKKAASKIGCMVLTTPFRYLGSKVEGLMSRIQSWSDIIEGMEARLSRWKLKTLYIGERLTLIKSVLGAIHIYHMSMFKVPMQVLQKLESIRARVFNGTDGKSRKPSWVRWKSVMASKDTGALHGDGGKIDKKITLTYPSIWLSIVQEIDVLKLQDTAFKVLAPRVYALETLKGITVAAKLSHGGLDQSLRRRPRGGAERSQLELLQEKIDGCILSNSNDRWSWSLDGVGDFTISSVRIAIDDYFLPKGTTTTRWIKEVPIKINIHAWKVNNDCFPTKFNMSRSGMEIDTILCPLCNSTAESSRHLFFSCKFSRDIMLKINRWWEVDHREVDSYDECVE
nr:RNA-directed DNA polymerase, eukaryota, reverse transcriptase zinc-binding domain protein [Tanacetum cinerariifolium]